MKSLSRQLLICLLVLHAGAPILADDGQQTSSPKYASVDLDTGDYVLVAAWAAVIGGTIWYVVKRSRKPRDKDKAEVSSVSKVKPKLDLYVDMAPIPRSLASPDRDIDYRVGLKIKF